MSRVRAAIGEAMRAARAARADAVAATAGAAEALQAVSDAAHGRWVKLLGARCESGGHEQQLVGNWHHLHWTCPIEKATSLASTVFLWLDAPVAAATSLGTRPGKARASWGFATSASESDQQRARAEPAFTRG